MPDIHGMPTAKEMGLKGWKVHFNSHTLNGRRNVVLLNYAAWILVGTWAVRRNNKKKQLAAAGSD